MWASLFTSRANVNYFEKFPAFLSPPDTSNNSANIRFPLTPTPDFPSTTLGAYSGLQLKNPSNVKSNVEYDPETGEYTFVDKISTMDYRPSRTMTLEEYQQYDSKKATGDYWKELANTGGKAGNKKFAPSFNIGGEAFDKIFGNNTINIVPQGNAELIFGYNISTVDNPALSEKLRTTPSFNFEEKIQMNVNGTIGDRVKMGISYNTNATFQFENKTKLGYTGGEDDILRKIELGNITMPLTGSLISGSQSLFGIKTELQFGKLNVVGVLSQQQGQTTTVNMQGGATVNNFSLTADQYEVNKHFFLSHHFEQNFNNALSSMPTPVSDIKITKLEVWITNKTSNFEQSRDIIAFMDLAEEESANIQENWITVKRGSRYPDNNSNNLYSTVENMVRNFYKITETLGKLTSEPLVLSRDYEEIENARLLSSREYSFDPLLGYISLNSALNADEVLGVAYEYTTTNGQTYTVGELSSSMNDPSKTLILKLIKGTTLSPLYKNWSLMMKNIYSLGAYQISKENFVMNVLYQDDRKGTNVNYLPETAFTKDILLRVMNLDNLNSQLEEALA